MNFFPNPFNNHASLWTPRYCKVENNNSSAINPFKMLFQHPKQSTNKKQNYTMPIEQMNAQMNDHLQLNAMLPPPQILTTEKIQEIQESIRMIIEGKNLQQQMSQEMKMLLKPLIQQYKKLDQITKKIHKITNQRRGKSVRQILQNQVQELSQNNSKLQKINEKLATLLNKERILNFPEVVVCEQYVNQLGQNIKKFIQDEARFETKYRLDVLVHLLKGQKAKNEIQQSFPNQQPIQELYTDEENRQARRVHQQIQKKWADFAINEVKKQINKLRPRQNKKQVSSLYNRNTSFIEQEEQNMGYLEDILQALSERMKFDSIEDLLELLFYNQDTSAKWNEAEGKEQKLSLVTWIKEIEERSSNLLYLMDIVKREKEQLQEELKKVKQQVDIKLNGQSSLKQIFNIMLQHNPNLLKTILQKMEYSRYEAVADLWAKANENILNCYQPRNKNPILQLQKMGITTEKSEIKELKSEGRQLVDFEEEIYLTEQEQQKFIRLIKRSSKKQ